jgi:hypothetical protein
MQTFKIFENQNGKVEFVKQGWSWPAFFFTWFWLLVKKMWVLGIIYLLCLSIYAVGKYYPFPGKTLSAIGGFICGGAHLLLGALGNMMREKNLLSRGFHFRTTVTGLDQEDAAASLSEKR